MSTLRSLLRRLGGWIHDCGVAADGCTLDDYKAAVKQAEHYQRLAANYGEFSQTAQRALNQALQDNTMLEARLADLLPYVGLPITTSPRPRRSVKGKPRKSKTSKE